MINGLIEPTSGDIFIDGETIKIKILLNFVVTLVMRFKEVCYFPYDSKTKHFLRAKFIK